ncbi:outer membrane protein transport protein (OMPP1/FadL/TodX) [Isoalcanivorax pacificus W11-5]|uniref:Outer membrane protein transport protein (OMPP1/FadL/TodX) n=2 Tax=Isoalcanivorax TaxID=3020833 RepID=A0A0B4XF25_9GAMM|nr:outer membrane protein transport protein [Isoalcanivorax pacificus]AJD46624.1 outer membrane protein transport protein (OMPP1/FadL/TodX) [Isoalcanivorax pacificus W11-5]
MSASRRYGRLACCTGGLLLSVMITAQANMGNTATTYGVLPTDIASAQALSLFNSQVSATYYNPAYLAADTRGELTGGLFHADHELRVNSQGGPQPIVRAGGDVLEDDPSQQVLIGMKTNLTSLTRYDRPLYLGFMAGVEKYGKEMMAFNSQTSQEGQFFNYGRQPLFLNIGGAMQLWRGIDVGVSARVTLHSSADLSARTDLAGNTQYEALSVEAKPVFRPIVGVNINWGETLCSQTDCWLDNLETAFSYRGYSNTHTSVKANTVIPGTIPSPGLTLAIKTLDSFQPEIIAAGVQYRFGRARVGFTGEIQRWSRLEDEFERDTLKDQANLSFRDIFIPRLGAEFQVNDIFSVTTGVAYEKSALKSDRSLDVNYLDNDRLVVGLGVSAEFKNAPILAYPVRLDVGYQYHHLRDRDFDLVSSDPNVTTNPYETVTADGEVHVFSGSITLKF